MGRKQSFGFIFTGYYGGTYIARFQRKTASCTSGREMAAERVAKKVLGKKPFALKCYAQNTAFFEVVVKV